MHFSVCQHSGSSIVPVDRTKFAKIKSNYIYATGTPEGSDREKRLANTEWLYKGQDVEKLDEIAWVDLEQRMGALRALVNSMTKSVISQLLMDGFKKTYGESTIPDLQELTTVEQICQYLEFCELNKETRAIAFFAVHGYWGTSGTWARVVEQICLDRLGLRYDGRFNDTCLDAKLKRKPDRKKKIHSGGFIKNIAIIQKNSLTDRITKRLIKSKKEVFYVKLMKTKCKKEVRWIRTTTVDRDGFSGLIGICAGHSEEFIKHKSLVWKREDHQFHEDTDGGILGENLSPETPKTKSAMMKFLQDMNPETPEDALKLIQNWSSHSSPEESSNENENLIDENITEDDDPLLTGDVADLLPPVDTIGEMTEEEVRVLFAEDTSLCYYS